MTIPVEFLAVAFTAILGLQGWSLIELVGLKVKVAALQQQLKDCRELCQTNNQPIPFKPKYEY